MKIIVCIDKNNGMMFNNRRQSQDKILIDDIIKVTKDKKLYMKKGASCWYKQVSPVVCSTHCLECVSCMGVIEGVGVVCEKRLKDACVSFPA